MFGNFFKKKDDDNIQQNASTKSKINLAAKSMMDPVEIEKIKEATKVMNDEQRMVFLNTMMEAGLINTNTIRAKVFMEKEFNKDIETTLKDKDISIELDSVSLYIESIKRHLQDASTLLGNNKKAQHEIDELYSFLKAQEILFKQDLIRK